MSIGLRTKLLSVLGAGIIGLGVIAGICFSMLSKSVNNFESLVHEEVAAALAADKMTIAFKVQVQEWKNVLLRGHDAASLDKYWGRFKKNHEVVQSLGLEAKALTPLNDVKAQIETFLKEHNALLPKYEKGYQAFIASGFDHKVGDKAVSGIDREPTKLGTAVTDLLSERSLTQAQITEDNAESTIVSGSIVIVVAMIAMFAVSYFFINMWIMVPLNLVRTYLYDLSHGVLDFNVAKDTGDECGQMYTAVRELQGNLNGSVTAILNSLNELGTSSSALNQIAATIEKGTHQQYQRTDQIATAITEMSAASGEVANHASSAADLANKVESAAKNGVSSMRQAIATINSTSEQIASTAEVVRHLEEDTKSVGTVLDVIKGIAEQTNLLALNAAIEAARAGEQGRGFAVVADEVRTLAQRTQESTAEIHTIIENVQTGAQNAVTAIETGQSRTEASVTQVNQAGATIEEISNAVQQILGTNEQIAQAAMEQSSVAEDISKNVNEVSSIAQESADNAKSTLQYSEQLQNMAKTLGALVKKLKAS